MSETASPDGPAQELQLALNELTPEGVPELAKALRGMSALQRLNLRENELESAGAVALAPVLSSLHALQVCPLLNCPCLHCD